MSDLDGDRKLSKLSDEELMQSFKEGEAPAFRELFECYKNPVFAFVRRSVNDTGRAEEITQAIFLALVQRRNGYEARGRFRTYLYKIALNRVASEHLRHRERPRTGSECTPVFNSLKIKV